MVNQASSLDRDERRVVALEIRSVDDDSVDNSRCAEPYDGVVMTVVAAATGSHPS